MFEYFISKTCLLLFMIGSPFYIFDSIQVVRGDFIVFFNQIFDALCKLSADSDANVQSAAHLLDRLVKVKSYYTYYSALVMLLHLSF